MVDVTQELNGHISATGAAEETAFQGKLQRAKENFQLAARSNEYFAGQKNGDLQALIAFMAQQGKESYQRKDFQLMEDVRSGYGGKGFAPGSRRFFEAMEQAIGGEKPLVEYAGATTVEKKKPGDFSLWPSDEKGITYRLTDAGRAFYESIKQQLPELPAPQESVMR